MGVFARSCFSTLVSSREAGRKVAEEAIGGADAAPAVLLAYASVNHDQAGFLRGVHEVLPTGTAVLGCSAQGIMSRGVVAEDGYLAGAIALGGSSLGVVTSHVEGIHVDSAAKGRDLGRSLCADLSGSPRAVILLYDPLCGADMDVFLASLFEEVRCPIIGGGASQPHGPMVRTFQYYDDRAFSGGAVAVALDGTFGMETAVCHGTSPVGIEMIVTRADGPMILELDGRPALEVWQEMTSAGQPDLENTAALAVGIPADDDGLYLVRAAFGTDAALGGVLLQASLPTGTPVMLHHRTIEGVLGGTTAMARDLSARLGGRKVRAVLGFECGARTASFLGHDRVMRENLELQDAIGGDPAWLGLLAWGELYPLGGRPQFHNYTYPILAITD
ncbi:MAG TPA: FIST N-terminal domain-containing protein [Kofleriaceae bacterium]|nr:FIST N-terminal domain-containing protein [Kofleriaceae bacterium]